jgi:predicted tellurium resistance membrane protein TerC
MDSLLAIIGDPSAWAALVALVVMEVVLGIDNLIFIAILTNRLPEDQRENARRIGLTGALFLRLALLATIAIIVTLTRPVFIILEKGFSWRDLILIAGGLFLVWKATQEIHHRVDPDADDMLESARPHLGFGAAIGQILLLDLSSRSTASSPRSA